LKVPVPQYAVSSLFFPVYSFDCAICSGEAFCISVVQICCLYGQPDSCILKESVNPVLLPRVGALQRESHSAEGLETLEACQYGRTLCQGVWGSLCFVRNPSAHNSHSACTHVLWTSARHRSVLLIDATNSFKKEVLLPWGTLFQSVDVRVGLTLQGGAKVDITMFRNVPLTNQFLRLCARATRVVSLEIRMPRCPFWRHCDQSLENREIFFSFYQPWRRCSCLRSLPPSSEVFSFGHQHRKCWGYKCSPVRSNQSRSSNPDVRTEKGL
jgi:hypothetical protein